MHSGPAPKALEEYEHTRRMLEAHPNSPALESRYHLAWHNLFNKQTLKQQQLQLLLKEEVEKEDANTP